MKMTIREICELVEGNVVCCKRRLDDRVDYGFASDLMSDILTLKTENFMMITGLANIQLVRTAEMSDVYYILLCRSKSATVEMIEIARESNITIIETSFSVFKSAGILYCAGLKAIY